MMDPARNGRCKGLMDISFRIEVVFCYIAFNETDHLLRGSPLPINIRQQHSDSFGKFDRIDRQPFFPSLNSKLVLTALPQHFPERLKNVRSWLQPIEFVQRFRIGRLPIGQKLNQISTLASVLHCSQKSRQNEKSRGDRKSVV